MHSSDASILAYPLVAIDEIPRQEWSRLRVGKLLGPVHSSLGVSSDACALVLPVIHRLFSSRIAPVVPPCGNNGGGDVGVQEHDPGVRTPSAANVDRPVPGDVATNEGKPASLRFRHLLLGGQGPAARVGNRVQMTCLIIRLTVAEDEVDGALDVAIFEVMPPLLVV